MYLFFLQIKINRNKEILQSIKNLFVVRSFWSPCGPDRNDIKFLATFRLQLGVVKLKGIPSKLFSRLCLVPECLSYVLKFQSQYGNNAGNLSHDLMKFVLSLYNASISLETDHDTNKMCNLLLDYKTFFDSSFSSDFAAETWCV